MKVIVGQPISKPWQWVVNLVDDGETTTVRIYTGPKAQNLAKWFGLNLAAEKRCEFVMEG